MHPDATIVAQSRTPVKAHIPATRAHNTSPAPATRKLQSALRLLRAYRPDLASDEAAVLSWLTTPYDDEDVSDWHNGSPAWLLACEYVESRIWPDVLPRECVAIELGGRVVRLHMNDRGFYSIEDCQNSEALKPAARAEWERHFGGLPGSWCVPCPAELAARAVWTGVVR